MPEMTKLFEKLWPGAFAINCIKYWRYQGNWKFGGFFPQLSQFSCMGQKHGQLWKSLPSKSMAVTQGWLWTSLSWRAHLTNEQFYQDLPRVTKKIQQRRMRPTWHSVRHPEEPASQWKGCQTLEENEWLLWTTCFLTVEWWTSMNWEHAWWTDKGGERSK